MFPTIMPWPMTATDNFTAFGVANGLGVGTGAGVVAFSSPPIQHCSMRAVLQASHASCSVGL